MRTFLVTAGMFALAASAAVASTVSVINSESVSFNNVPSFNAFGDPGNTTLPASLTGGFQANQVSLTGTLSNVGGDAATWASEARVNLNGPGLATPAATTEQAYVGPLPVGGSFSSPAFDPASITGFEFFESFDDDASIQDQEWLDITLTFEEVAVQNGNFALGALPAGPTQTFNGSHVANGLDFYTISIGALGAGDYLNIATFDNGGVAMDTEIALYDAAGNLVATDDDGQDTGLGGLYSMLSFGASDPLTGTDTAPGEDGATLAAGNYTIVTGGFNTDFTASINDIVAGTSAGDYGLDVTFVPEPGTIGLLLIGLAGLARRR